MTIMHDPWFQRTTNSYVFLISNCHLPQPSQTVSPPGSLWFAQPGRGSLKVFQAFQATFHFRTFYPGDTADGAGDTPQICWYATPWFCILLWVYANYPLGKAPRPLAPTEAAAQQWCWPQGHGPRSGRQFKLTCCCVTRHVNTNSTWSDSISLPPDMLQETRAGADTKTYGKLNPKGCRTKQKPFHDSENPCARLRKHASLSFLQLQKRRISLPSFCQEDPNKSRDTADFGDPPPRVCASSWARYQLRGPDRPAPPCYNGPNCPFLSFPAPQSSGLPGQ